eukprot:TRINITY_DN7090_c0_g1_i3.p1 TRINITY_DN7090_c0_g1~~TRINITY_DN7090_c0_g1_i3.p1  ORF type:complete len:294 (+),score=14.49 TRINITY_DN7090_c0_g1_i3:409-1290(+)
MPHYIHYFYAFVLVPLLTIRFLMYHKMKYHYFMLDFCYFHQLLQVMAIYFFPYSEKVFYIAFSLGNGPVLFGIVAWHNMLVFHDIDKVTSLFIHIIPSLVSFCYRWFPQEGSPVYGDYTPELGFYYIYLPVVVYMFWQASYLIKTEILDKKKLDNDPKMVTSLRWMVKVRPHFLYKMTVRRIPLLKSFPVLILVGYQLLYTVLCVSIVIFMYKYFWVHVIMLLSVFGFSVFYGANYYFDIFSENYSSRLERNIKKKDGTGTAEYIPEVLSVLSFIPFIFMAGAGLYSLLYTLQ